MTKTSRRIKVTALHRRVTRTQPAALRARCLVCGREVEIITSAQAAEILQVSNRILEGLIADREVHAVPTVSGNRWVCKESLFLKD
jgi:hypothetical protein